MARFNLAKLRTRTLSALVIAPLVVVLIYYSGWPFLALLVALGAIAMLEWINLARKTSHPALFLGFGIIYVIGIFYCFFLIRDLHGLSLSVMFVCMIWASDSGAFFAGKLIGGPKMCPGISPNKTWAGLAGAALFPALLALIWIGYDDFVSGAAFEKTASYVMVFGGGLLIGIVGQLGDLLMSFVKRRAGAKDSGTLIPGHGGLLDRIDALMLAGPVFLVLAGSVFYVP